MVLRIYSLGQKSCIFGLVLDRVFNLHHGNIWLVLIRYLKIEYFMLKVAGERP